MELKQVSLDALITFFTFAQFLLHSLLKFPINNNKTTRVKYSYYIFQCYDHTD